MAKKSNQIPNPDKIAENNAKWRMWAIGMEFLRYVKFQERAKLDATANAQRALDCKCTQ